MDWCILRTCGRRTLNLASSLNEAGIEAWSPRRTYEQRVSRGSKAKRERTEPLMPSFVFARADHLDRLLALSHRPGTMEPFTVFHYLGAVPLISDRNLEPLRVAERRAIPKRRQQVFRPGQSVKVTDGVAEGMRGIVEQTEGQYTLVAFGGSFRLKISNFILQLEEKKGVELAA